MLGNITSRHRFRCLTHRTKMSPRLQRLIKRTISLGPPNHPPNISLDQQPIQLPSTYRQPSSQPSISHNTPPKANKPSIFQARRRISKAVRQPANPPHRRNRTNHQYQTSKARTITTIPRSAAPTDQYETIRRPSVLLHRILPETQITSKPMCDFIEDLLYPPTHSPYEYEYFLQRLWQTRGIAQEQSPRRSRFARVAGYLLTCGWGGLVPAWASELLPLEDL